jgi:PAS domain S-box-containing protein
MGNYEQAVDQLKKLQASGFDIDFDELRGLVGASEVWWKLFSEALRVGLVFADLKGHVIAVSPGIETLFGYTEDELRVLGMPGITHPEDRESDAGFLMELVGGTRERYQLEKRYIKKDESVIWGDLTVMLLKDSMGTPSFVVAMIEDVTETKLAADYVRRLESLNQRRQQALELNDLVLQTLVVAKWAFDRGDGKLAKVSLDSTFSAARELIDGLLKDTTSQAPIGPGDLVRTEPATIRLESGA